MSGNFLDIIVILIFLFFGIRYLRTREFEDKKNKYTDESKRKAALLLGITLLACAIFDAVIFILRMKGMISSSTSDGVAYFAPVVGILVLLIVMIIIVYTLILKKK